MRKETANRAHQIQAFLAEAVIPLDDDTIQDRIRTIRIGFFRVFRRWYRDEVVKNRRRVNSFVNTSSLVGHLNDLLLEEEEYGVQFDTEVAGDPDLLITGGSYSLPRDVIIVNLIRVYRFPRPPDAPFSLNLRTILTSILNHEFVHRGQLQRRTFGTIPRKPEDRIHRPPHFGTRAHQVAREQNARTLAQAKERGTEITKEFRQENLVHAAKSLNRRGFFTIPDRAVLARDTIHARRDPLRRYGHDEPRHMTGTQEYHGHPEELMALAGDFARLALDSRHLYPKDVGDYATNLATHYYKLIQDNVGTNTPAYKQFLKYVYQYLALTLSHEDIRTLMSTIIWGVPRYRGGFPQRP